MGEKYCGDIHIYGARAIFLLVCGRQGTESESQELEMSKYQPIFNQKNIKGSIRQQYLYHTIWGETLWQLFIIVQIDPFL